MVGINSVNCINGINGINSINCINCINSIIITFYAGQSLWLTWITELQCNNVLSIEIIKFEGN